LRAARDVVFFRQQVDVVAQTQKPAEHLFALLAPALQDESA
jgi:hypothetical protein